MKLIENIKTKALEQAFYLRSGLYFAESLPIQLFENYMVRGELGLQKVPVDEKYIIESIKTLIEKDAENLSKGVYPLSVVSVDKPIQHIKNLVRIYLDSVNVVLNKKYKRHKEFSDETKRKVDKVPDYYKRNFHNQTDGYLSKDSAELYNHQVDILFRGTSDAMRRLMLEALSKFYKSNRRLKIIEVACGTGVSTRPLALTYKNSKIHAVDLSKDYIEFAKEDQDFENVKYSVSSGEDLKSVKDCSLDVWCSTYLFHELPKEVRKEVIQEAFRVLKPGGRIFILDSIQEHDRPELKPILDLFPQNFHEPFYKNYVLNPIEDMLSDCGFEGIESFNRASSKVAYGVKNSN
jgi:ubiquinone/menaquinone biosynthesis C-methylase UbiE